MPAIINSDDGVISGTAGLKTSGANDGITVFQQNGTESMRIDSSGNITVKDKIQFGIDAQTHIQAGGTSDVDLIVAGDTNIRFETATNERMRIDSSGNVGIGTTSPVGRLHIETSSGSAAFFVNSPSATDVGSYISLRKAGSAKFLLGVESALGGTSDNGALYVYGANALTMYTNGSERARIDSSGRLMLGTTTTSISSLDAKYFDGADGQRLFSSRGSTAFREHVIFQNPNGTVGTISTSGSATTYATSSDYRLKHDITPMTGALAKVAALKPVTYKWNADNSAGEGFIAHELAEVVPQCVTGEKDATRMEQYEISPAVPATYDDDGNELTPAVAAVMGEREVPAYQGIDTSFLVATLTAAIQELKAELDATKAEVAALKAAAAK